MKQNSCLTESNFGNSEGQGQHQRALLARLGHVECQLLARRPNPPEEAGGKKMKKGRGEEEAMKREETKKHRRRCLSVSGRFGEKCGASFGQKLSSSWNIYL